MKKTLSDKIIRVVTTSLEYPDDGRRICEMKSDSELLCQRLKEDKRHYDKDFVEIEDVKKALKEFMDKLFTGDDHTFKEHMNALAKEIFGERLIK